MNLPNAPAPRGHGGAHYWREIQRFGEAGFTLRSLLARTSGVGRVAVGRYVTRLKRLGLVKVIGTEARQGARFPAPVYAAATKSKNPPPMHDRRFTGRGGLQQAQLWTAMRTLSQWVLAELAAVASTEDCPVPVDTAAHYTRSLLRADLVVVLRPCRRGNGGAQPATYRLKASANTGPMPPRVVKGRGVYDPNRQLHVAFVDTAERKAARDIAEQVSA